MSPDFLAGLVLGLAVGIPLGIWEHQVVCIMTWLLQPLTGRRM